MEAYAVVDSNTRRKMEEMLKTWKEPVPGSIDTRPVFPSDVTRPIETALIKARTSALQAHQEFAARNQQQLSRARPGMQPTPTPYRETPTPPGVIRHVSQAPGYVASYGYVTNPSDQQYGGTLQIQQPYGASQVSFIIDHFLE
jgi:pre-mRNA cleavage complex 2 protein Pcf11